MQGADATEDVRCSGSTCMIHKILEDARCAREEMGSELQSRVLELGDNMRKVGAGISGPVKRKLEGVGQDLCRARESLSNVTEGLVQKIQLPSIDLRLPRRREPFIQIEVDTDLIPLNRNVHWKNVKLGFASLSTVAVESRPLTVPALPDLGGFFNRLRLPFMEKVDGTGMQFLHGTDLNGFFLHRSSCTICSSSSFRLFIQTVHDFLTCLLLRAFLFGHLTLHVVLWCT